MNCDAQAIVNPSDIVIEEDDPEQILQRADRIKGVGFDKQHILSMSSTKGLMQQAAGAKEEKNKDVTLNKMNGMNVDDLKYLDQQKKLTMITFLTEKIKAEKEARKLEKKASKQEKRDKKKSSSSKKHKSKKHHRR